jgi:hypothetical protein
MTRVWKTSGAFVEKGSSFAASPMSDAGLSAVCQNRHAGKNNNKAAITGKNLHGFDKRIRVFKF